MPKIAEQYCAVVTGASSGIGAAFAAELAVQGRRVVLIARRTDRLEKVAASLPPGTCECITADVAQPGSAEETLHELERRGLVPDLLVNNAGIGDYRLFAEADLERLHTMIALNSQALLDWTHAFLRSMLARRRGAIVQVASGVVFVPAPKMATYAATKAFVHALGEALPFELHGTGVQYLTLYPGSTESEFFVGAGMHQPPGTVPAVQVAREGLRALARGKTRHVVGGFNRFGSRIVPLLPKSLVARMAARMTQ